MVIFPLKMVLFLLKPRGRRGTWYVVVGMASGVGPSGGEHQIHPRRLEASDFGKSVAKSTENLRKLMENLGKSWEINGKIMEHLRKPMENLRKSREIMGNLWKIYGKSKEIYGKSKELYGNLTLWGNSHIVRI